MDPIDKTTIAVVATTTEKVVSTTPSQDNVGVTLIDNIGNTDDDEGDDYEDREEEITIIPTITEPSPKQPTEIETTATDSTSTTTTATTTTTERSTPIMTTVVDVASTVVEGSSAAITETPTETTPTTTTQTTLITEPEVITSTIQESTTNTPIGSSAGSTGSSSYSEVPLIALAETTTEVPTEMTTESSTTTSTTTTTTSTMPSTTTTERMTTTETIEYGFKNFPPQILHRLKKIHVPAGTVFRYTIPENTFQDIEDGWELRLRFIDPSEKRAEWIHFDERNREVYGLPLEEHVSKYDFLVEATDKEGASVSDKLEVIVQQHKGSRTVTHEFLLRLRVEKKSEFPSAVDWQLQTLNALSKLFHNKDLTQIVVRSIRYEHDLVTFAWTNDTLPKSYCPKTELDYLLSVRSFHHFFDLNQSI